MGLFGIEGREGQGWDAGCLEGRGRVGQRKRIFHLGRALSGAAASTATPAARGVQDPGERRERRMGPVPWALCARLDAATSRRKC